MYPTKSISFNIHKVLVREGFISPFVKLASNGNKMNSAFLGSYTDISKPRFCDVNPIILNFRPATYVYSIKLN